MIADRSGGWTMEFENFTHDLRHLCMELLPYYIGSAHEKMDTKAKEDGTPVTDLDNYTLKRFRDLITSRFPGHFTIGEEDKRSAEETARIISREDQYQWSIDGLDGTWHYEAGTNSYGAALALRYGPTLLYAMYFRPIDMMLRGNGLFWAERGNGAWEWCGCKKCGGRYHRLHTVPYNSRRLTILLEGSSKRFWTTSVRNIGANITTRPSLSSCIATTTIARGESLEARVLVTSGHKPWDGWPIALFIEEASRETGGKVTDHQGNPYSASDCSNLVAAGNEVDHTRIIELLNPKEGG